MAFSSGARHALAEASMWLAAAAALVATIVYFDEIKGVFGLAMRSTHTQVASTNAPASAVAIARTAKVETSASASPSSFGNVVRLTAGTHGHFVTDAEVNGRRIEVMVDTGASVVALTHEDAQTVGIYVQPSDFKYQVQTANGPARIALVNLERVSIGNITVYDVRAAVGERGAMTTTLLGMSFLSKLRRTEMRGGELILED
jgi:aspartyl protease family protein